MKSGLILKLSLLFFLMLLLWTSFLFYQFFYTPLIHKNHTVSIIVKTGTPLSILAKDLHRQGLLAHPLFFSWYARLRGDARRIQAGAYAVETNTTANDLLEQLVLGKVILHALTIVEGWTFQEALAALEDNPYLQHSLINKTSDEIMRKLGHPHQNPEGRFYPDTYLFGGGVSDLVILKQAYQKMRDVLRVEWKKRDKDLPYKNAYQALIMASLIEKETGLAREKPKIAGVLVRRLKSNMYLQVDPTVIYGLGAKFNGDLTKKDLTSETPYNSYIHKGLVPTPIALPDANSIHAALHPAQEKTMYYVAKGDGTHIFSDTLLEHQKAVANYLALERKKAHQRWQASVQIVNMFREKSIR